MTATTDLALQGTLRTIARGTDVPIDYQQMKALARDLAGSKMLPRHLQGDEASILSVMIASRSLDIPLWSGIQGLIVIEGKTGMSAHMMQALVLRAGFGLFPVQEECDTERAVVRCVRPGIASDGSGQAFVTFTIGDALQAKLVERRDDGTLYARSEKNGRITVLPWEKYGNQMLKRRAVSVGARDYYQDILLGMAYLPEEIGGVVDEDGNPVHRDTAAPLRMEVDPRVEEYAMRIVATDTEEALETLWNEIQAKGVESLMNMREETLNALVTRRLNQIRRRDGKPAPKAEATAAAPKSEPSTETAPADTESPADAPADDGPVPDPPETRQDDDTREGVCNALAGLYDDWDAAAAAIIETFGLHPDDIATARLEEFARARIAEQEGK